MKRTVVEDVCAALAALTGKAAILAATCLALSAQGVTKYSVGADETFTLDAYDTGNNKDDAELTAEAGATIVLNAPDSANVTYSLTRLYLTGSGTVTLVAPDENYAAQVVVFANGLAAASDNVTLHVAAPSVTALKVGRFLGDATVHYAVVDIANVTFANEQGMFGLRNDVTVVKLPATYSVNEDSRLALYGNNPLRLGSSFTLSSYDVVLLSADAIPSTCTVTVNPGRTLAFKPCSRQNINGEWSYNWHWNGITGTSGMFPVVLNGKGARVLCRNASQNQIRLLATITGVGEILFRPDTEDQSPVLYKGMTWRAKKSYPVSLAVNTEAELAESAGDDSSWTNKVSHWFDASHAETVIKYTRTSTSLRNKFEGQYPIVVGWTDHVKGYSDKFLYSRDAQNGHWPYMLPYLVEGGLNGKDYLSFGKYYYQIDMTTVDSQDCSSGEHIRRWLQFVAASTSAPVGNAKPSGGYTTLTGCKYCIMVFGSQYGGGKSILGEQQDDVAPNNHGNMARGDSLITQNWFAYAGYSIMADGWPINTTDKPNGGWQIVSIDMSATNTVLDCLGGHFVTKESKPNLLDSRNFNMTGGQNYAEILFFGEVPTDAERAACERYLAKKWGLTASYGNWDTSFIEVSGGVGRKLSLKDINKARTGATEIAVAGNYTGTIEVPEGKTLVVSDRSAPLAPYDIPQQANITAWFDPSLDGAIDFNEHPDASTGIARLYSRTAAEVDKADGAYWMGMNAGATTGSPTGIGNKNARYPFLVNTFYMAGSGIGMPMDWMDFSKNASGDTTSNNLRSHKLPVKDSHITNVNTDSMPVRSVFMALETSLGGGNPIADTVGMNGMFRPRGGTSIASPIWSSANTVTMTHTWLDTNEVNGATAGYNGRAEVLGFEMSEQKTMPVFLGYYNQGGNKNYEHIGETLIYSTTLTDAERLAVQEYLMAKWTGDLGGKYSDLSRATVTGAGNVYSANLRNLPAFDSGFTGALSGGSNMTFTVDWSWNPSAAVDAIMIDRALTLDAGKVTVTLKRQAKAGTYTLLTVPSGTLAGKTFALTLVNETEKGATAKLVTSDTTLSLEILSQGTVLIVR